jgi:hypothetical protein
MKRIRCHLHSSTLTFFALIHTGEKECETGREDTDFFLSFYFRFWLLIHFQRVKGVIDVYSHVLQADVTMTGDHYGHLNRINYDSTQYKVRVG